MAPRHDIYLEHFGLRQRPFALLPDPDFLFWSEAHRAAHAMMDYGLMTRAPITLITGEIGVGKTTLVRHFLARLEPDVTVGFIANAPPGTREILQWVLPALGQEAPEGASDVALFHRFRSFLVGEQAAGRSVLLVIDEAQNLGRAALEELRMLTNIDAGREELLQLLLVGQPELRARVQAADMQQLAQRVAASFHIPAMDPATVLGYIAHRLQVAGGTPALFSRQAATLVQTATGGVPRLVNQLCDLALTYAFSAGLGRVREATVRQVLDDGVFFAGGTRQPATGPARGPGPGAAGRTAEPMSERGAAR